MKKERLDEITQYWIAHSDYDFETAKAMLKGKRYLYVAFMCQQAVEKLIKAVITFKIKISPPRIHDLTKLAFISKIDNNLNDEQQKFLAELTPFCIITRYAGYRKKLSQLIDIKLAKLTFEKTRELLKWIKQEEIYKKS